MPTNNEAKYIPLLIKDDKLLKNVKTSGEKSAPRKTEKLFRV